MVGFRNVWAALFLVACGGVDTSSVEVDDETPAAARDERSLAQTESPLAAKNALSMKESKTALKLIDDICGDTWCSGDFNFAFRRLSCAAAAGTCTLTLQIFPREGVSVAKRSYFRSCKTHGFTGFGSLVDTAPNGYQSLTQNYYDALTECTLRITSSLR